MGLSGDTPIFSFPSPLTTIPNSSFLKNPGHHSPGFPYTIKSAVFSLYQYI